jgi:hypothetical protein
MIDVSHFRLWVIKPTLEHLGMWSPAAEQLMIGTALQESRLTYLVQLGGGPAVGVYQIEPDTHDDIWRNYLKGHEEIRAKVYGLRADLPTPIRQLHSNLAYATAIARLVYWRKTEPLPEANDLRGLADYWKRHYNTPAGGGRRDEFTAVYKRYVGD